MTSRSVATPPLLVVLHGHASSPADAAAFAERIDPDRAFHHVTPVGPLVVDGGLAWFDDSAESVAAAARTVALLLVGLASDQPAPVIAVGYSQGAAALLAALAMADTPPVRLAAAACVSGFLPDTTGWEWQLDRLGDMPILIQHGRDDEVVPSFLATDLVTMLEHAGASVTHDEADAGHEITDPMVAALRSWLATVGVVEVSG